MTSKKESTNSIQTKESIRAELVNQQKQAYYLCKYLRSKTNPSVSYVISTEIVFRNGMWIPVTKIEELPHIQIHHDLADSEEQFLKKIDIENIEG